MPLKMDDLKITRRQLELTMFPKLPYDADYKVVISYRGVNTFRLDSGHG